MTNADKYLKDEVSVEELARELEKWYFKIERRQEKPYNLIADFMRTTITPTLTEDERVILRNIAYDSEYKYIYRSLGMLYLSENKTLTCVDRLPGMHHLFQFIKERRRI